MKRKLSIAGGIAAFLVLAGVGIMLGVFGSRDRNQVALTFEKDSGFWPYDYDTAILWFTNKSSTSYLVQLVTNKEASKGQSGIFGGMRWTWRLKCAFEDETPRGWSNWMQGSFTNTPSIPWYSVPAHSGLWVRVPLPLDGRKRKAAVICAATLNPAKFWATTATGRRLVTTMPKAMNQWLFGFKWKLVWCDKELSLPTEPEPNPPKPK